MNTTSSSTFVLLWRFLFTHRFAVLAWSASALLAPAGRCCAQFGDAPSIDVETPSEVATDSPIADAATETARPDASQSGEKNAWTVEQWKVGVRITAKGGACAGLFATLPVPSQWEDQMVDKISEDASKHISRIRFRQIDGVRQMLIAIPQLNSGETAQAIFVYQVSRRANEAPKNTEELVISKRLPRQLKKYLAPSPGIESRHREIRNLAASLKDDSLPAWKQTEVLYDWVRKNVTYENGKFKGALAALRDRSGDCEELTSLFIALCRCLDIPARTVWIPGHCYPEFYLDDAEGVGHWFPCQAAGTREFGSMHDPRPILQKGDNFRVPEKKERQRYVSEYLTGKASAGGGKPACEFIRESIEVDP